MEGTPGSYGIDGKNSTDVTKVIYRYENKILYCKSKRMNMMADNGNGRRSLPLTINTLADAIRNGIDGRRMEDSAAKTMAEHVLHFFGFSERIIDNILEQEDRDVFYMLEDAGLLTTEREETTLYDGREWRIHYWLFHMDKIKKLSKLTIDQQEVDPDRISIYDDIPEGVWLSRMEMEE